MYDVTMVKDPRDCDFRDIDRIHRGCAWQKDSLKKVRVVQASDQPVFGYIDGKGRDANPTDKQYLLVRTPSTTLWSLSLDHYPEDL
jgi:hypothetical protein